MKRTSRAGPAQPSFLDMGTNQDELRLGCLFGRMKPVFDDGEDDDGDDGKGNSFLSSFCDLCLSVSLSLCLSVTFSLCDLSYFGEWGSIGQVWLTGESSERLACGKTIIIIL